MYSTLDIIDVAESKAKVKAMEDRMKYKIFIEAGEQFIADHRLIIGGRSATRMLLLESPNVDFESFHYEIYSEHAPRYAKMLAMALYQIDPDGLGHYTTVITKIANYMLAISVDGRELFNITTLPVHRGTATANVVTPIQKPAQFATSGTNEPRFLSCMGPDIQLIQLYSNLYSPAKAADYGELIHSEIGLRQLFVDELKLFIQTIGGGKKKKTTRNITKLIIAIRDSFTAGEGRVLIGQLAISILTGKEIRNTERLQFISVNPLEREAKEIVEVANKIGFQVSWKIDDPKVLTDPRIRRMTLYNGTGAHREPFCDIFNTAAFNIIPYINVKDLELRTKNILPSSLKIGTPFVLMCYRLIDLWTIKILLKMDILTPNQTINIIKSILNDYIAVASYYISLIESDIEENIKFIMPISSHYIGKYEDIALALKRSMQKKSDKKFYPPYMPAMYSRSLSSNVDPEAPASYIKSVSEPWFSLIADKKKVVEGRLNKGDFKIMKAGDSITFTNKSKKINVVITKITHYKSFEDYLESETLERCLPGIFSLEEGISIYHKFYTPSDEQLYGIQAITFLHV